MTSPAYSFLYERARRAANWDEPILAYLRATNPLPPSYLVTQEAVLTKVAQATATKPLRTAGGAVHPAAKPLGASAGNGRTTGMTSSPAKAGGTGEPALAKVPHTWHTITHAPNTGEAKTFHVATALGAHQNRVIAGPEALHGVHLHNLVDSIPQGHDLTFHVHPQGETPAGFNQHPHYGVADRAHLPSPSIRQSAGALLDASAHAPSSSPHSSSPAPLTADPSGASIPWTAPSSPAGGARSRNSLTTAQRTPNAHVSQDEATWSMNKKTATSEPGIQQKNIPRTQQEKLWRKADDDALHSPEAQQLVEFARDRNGELGPKAGFSSRAHIRTLMDYLPTIPDPGVDPEGFHAEMEGFKRNLRSLVGPGKSAIRVPMGTGMETLSPLSVAHAYQMAEHAEKHGTMPHWWNKFSTVADASPHAPREDVPPDEAKYLNAPSTPGMRDAAEKRMAAGGKRAVMPPRPEEGLLGPSPTPAPQLGMGQPSTAIDQPPTATGQAPTPAGQPPTVIDQAPAQAAQPPAQVGQPSLLPTGSRVGRGAIPMPPGGVLAPATPNVGSSTPNVGSSTPNVGSSAPGGQEQAAVPLGRTPTGQPLPQTGQPPAVNPQAPLEDLSHIQHLLPQPGAPLEQLQGHFQQLQQAGNALIAQKNALPPDDPQRAVIRGDIDNHRLAFKETEKRIHQAGGQPTLAPTVPAPGATSVAGPTTAPQPGTPAGQPPTPVPGPTGGQPAMASGQPPTPVANPPAPASVSQAPKGQKATPAPAATAPAAGGATTLGQENRRLVDAARNAPTDEERQARARELSQFRTATGYDPAKDIGTPASREHEPYTPGGQAAPAPTQAPAKAPEPKAPAKETPKSTIPQETAATSTQAAQEAKAQPLAGTPAAGAATRKAKAQPAAPAPAPSAPAPAPEPKAPAKQAPQTTTPQETAAASTASAEQAKQEPLATTPQAGAAKTKKSKDNPRAATAPAQTASQTPVPVKEPKAAPAAAAPAAAAPAPETAAPAPKKGKKAADLSPDRAKRLAELQRQADLGDLGRNENPQLDRPALTSLEAGATTPELVAHMRAHHQAATRIGQYVDDQQGNSRQRPNDARWRDLKGQHEALREESRTRLNRPVKELPADVNPISQRPLPQEVEPDQATAGKVLSAEELAHLSPGRARDAALEREAQAKELANREEKKKRGRIDSRPYHADADETLPDLKDLPPAAEHASPAEHLDSLDPELLHHYTHAGINDLVRRHLHEAFHHQGEVERLGKEFEKAAKGKVKVDPDLPRQFMGAQARHAMHFAAAGELSHLGREREKLLNILHGAPGQAYAPPSAGGDQKAKQAERAEAAKGLFGPGGAFDTLELAKRAREISQSAKHPQDTLTFNHAPEAAVPDILSGRQGLAKGLTNERMLHLLNRMRTNKKLSDELMTDIGENYTRALNKRAGREDFDPEWEQDYEPPTSEVLQERPTLRTRRPAETAESPETREKMEAAEKALVEYKRSRKTTPAADPMEPFHKAVANAQRRLRATTNVFSRDEAERALQKAYADRDRAWAAHQEGTLPAAPEPPKDTRDRRDRGKPKKTPTPNPTVPLPEPGSALKDESPAKVLSHIEAVNQLPSRHLPHAADLGEAHNQVEAQARAQGLTNPVHLSHIHHRLRQGALHPDNIGQAIEEAQKAQGTAHTKFGRQDASRMGLEAQQAEIRHREQTAREALATHEAVAPRPHQFMTPGQGWTAEAEQAMQAAASMHKAEHSKREAHLASLLRTKKKVADRLSGPDKGPDAPPPAPPKRPKPPKTPAPVPQEEPKIPAPVPQEEPKPEPKPEPKEPTKSAGHVAFHNGREYFEADGHLHHAPQDSPVHERYGFRSQGRENLTSRPEDTKYASAAIRRRAGLTQAPTQQLEAPAATREGLERQKVQVRRQMDRLAAEQDTLRDDQEKHEPGNGRYFSHLPNHQEAMNLTHEGVRQANTDLQHQRQALLTHHEALEAAESALPEPKPEPKPEPMPLGPAHPDHPITLGKPQTQTKKRTKVSDLHFTQEVRDADPHALEREHFDPDRALTYTVHAHGTSPHEAPTHIRATDRVHTVHAGPAHASGPPLRGNLTRKEALAVAASRIQEERAASRERVRGAAKPEVEEDPKPEPKPEPTVITHGAKTSAAHTKSAKEKERKAEWLLANPPSTHDYATERGHKGALANNENRAHALRESAKVSHALAQEALLPLKSDLAAVAREHEGHAENLEQAAPSLQFAHKERAARAARAHRAFAQETRDLAGKVDAREPGWDQAEAVRGVANRERELNQAHPVADILSAGKASPAQEAPTPEPTPIVPPANETHAEREARFAKELAQAGPYGKGAIHARHQEERQAKPLGEPPKEIPEGMEAATGIRAKVNTPGVSRALAQAARQAAAENPHLSVESLTAALKDALSPKPPDQPS